MLVSYTIRTGDTLYFRESDTGIAEADRPYFPGILIDWEFELRDAGNADLYAFSLASQPAETFNYRAESATAEGQRPALYDAMADSAFEDLRVAILQRLGIGNGSKVGRGHSSSAPAPATGRTLPPPRQEVSGVPAEDQAGARAALPVGAKQSGMSAAFAPGVKDKGARPPESKDLLGPR
jgi:hypothetical protein